MQPRWATFAILLVLGSVPVLGQPYDHDPYDGDSTCYDEDNYDYWDHDGIECWPIQGPGSHINKQTGGIPLGYCNSPSDPGLYPCGTVGATPGYGAAFFGGVGFTRQARQQVSVWAEWESGTFPPVDGGFLMVLCNDRNHDDVCSTIAGGSPPDQVWQSTSNEAAVGADCSDGDKDLKECPDPTDAEIRSVCLERDLAGAWEPFQVRAYIATWSDNSMGNTGGGYSAGRYHVWLRHEGACP